MTNTPKTRARKPATKAPPQPETPRGGGAKSIGTLMPRVGGMAFRRFGFLHAELLARWSDIVGEVYAGWSVPESIRFPRGQKHDGTLTIRVEGPFAPQMQHVTPGIIERVNRIFGHAAVSRIRLVQGSVPRTPKAPVRPEPTDGPPVTNLQAVGDDALRTALEALARQVEQGARVPRIG